jgi:hypothetical protein
MQWSWSLTKGEKTPSTPKLSMENAFILITEGKHLVGLFGD